MFKRDGSVSGSALAAVVEDQIDPPELAVERRPETSVGRTRAEARAAEAAYQEACGRYRRAVTACERHQEHLRVSLERIVWLVNGERQARDLPRPVKVRDARELKEIRVEGPSFEMWERGRSAVEIIRAHAFPRAIAAEGERLARLVIDSAPAAMELEDAFFERDHARREAERTNGLRFRARVVADQALKAMAAACQSLPKVVSALLVFVGSWISLKRVVELRPWAEVPIGAAPGRGVDVGPGPSVFPIVVGVVLVVLGITALFLGWRRRSR